MCKFYPLLLLCAIGTVTFAGCDSTEDGVDDEYAAVLGRWEALGDPVEEDVYLNVTDEALVVHLFIENDPTENDCFDRDFAEVVSREGNRWTLREDDDPEGDDEEFTLVIRRDGDDLVIEDPSIPDGDVTRFESSTRTDFTPACE